ncbi:LysR family transcriptional regulator [Fructobacillus cardui]|uniref:LysR family transcriptional regulator n=1 Tax=Fructobacillus cardui TaxID=2893170 RepID=UPI00200AC188|nr:LysR family transcriptional regulator [Fructobacillus cardui]MCK8627374.1 LysR family transcriptional regulator [Fructobacillus cardui]
MNKFLALKIILEQQNITKAAKTLGYTQPAVTQMIASLENDLGFPLLIKKHRQISLTPEGERIFPFINQLLNDYQALKEQKQEIQGESTVIKIATIPSISQQWLPKLIANFQKQFENIEFAIIQGDGTSIPNWIENGEADIGFVNGDVTENGLVIQHQVLKAILPLPLAQKFPDNQPIPLADLTNYDYILLEEGLFSESVSEFQKIGIEPKMKLRLHDSFSTILMVEQGLGYSIMPMDEETEALYQIKSFDTIPAISRSINLLQKNDGLLTNGAKNFVKFVQTHRDAM